jgi:hypothetical protein
MKSPYLKTWHLFNHNLGMTAWGQQIRDDVLANTLERYPLQDLRAVVVGINWPLRQNKQFERAKIQGRLVVGLHLNVQCNNLRSQAG